MRVDSYSYNRYSQFSQSMVISWMGGDPLKGAGGEAPFNR